MKNIRKEIRFSSIPDTSSTKKKSGIKYLEWTPESKTVLNSFTRGDQVLQLRFCKKDTSKASYIWHLPLYQQMKTVKMGRPILSSDHQVKLSSAAPKQQSPLKLFTQSEKTYTQYFKLYNTIYFIFNFQIFCSIFFIFVLPWIPEVFSLTSGGSKRVFPERERTSRNQSTLAVVCLNLIPRAFSPEIEEKPWKRSWSQVTFSK